MTIQHDWIAAEYTTLADRKEIKGYGEIRLEWEA
jgi:hypothetical protein